MALARLSVKVGKKGKASSHAKYIAREGKYSKNLEVEKLEFIGHGNMPSWAEKNPNIFWQTADEFERKNGSAYREHIISLPRELTPEQRHEFLKDWIAQEIGDKHVYQYAIHNPKAVDGGEQPHAHLMFSERTLDNIERAPDQFFKRYNSKHPEKGGAKKANTGMKPAERRAELKEQRQRLENCYNKHLAKAGLNIQISMKSFADRNIDKEPINLSMTEFKKGSERVDAYKRNLQLSRELEQYQAELEQYQAELEQIELERLRKESEKHDFERACDDVDALIDNRAFIAECVSQFYRMSEKNKFGSHPYVQDGHIFDDEQMKLLDKFTDKIKTRSDWQNDVKYRIEHTANREFFEQYKYELGLAQSPDLERDYRAQQKISEKSDLKSSAPKNDLRNDERRTQTRRFRP